MKLSLALIIALALMATAAPTSAATSGNNEENSSYRIDQPGTITFTVGVTIKGKVEKPQVMIFLPKERPYYKPIDYSHAFTSDILEPLSFVPITE